jgi:hypothetical protein
MDRTFVLKLGLLQLDRESCRVFYLELGTFNSELFFACRSNSPSTAAAPPPAAANTGNCCAKNAFFRFLPQLSSPPGSDFSQKGHLKLTKLTNFSPIRFRRQSLLNTGKSGILTEGNACGTSNFPFSDRRECFQRIQRIEGKSITINVGQ